MCYLTFPKICRVRVQKSSLHLAFVLTLKLQEIIVLGSLGVCQMDEASRALKKEDLAYGQKLAEMAKVHSNEAFYALDDLQEVAVFSVLVEMIKKQSEKEDTGKETEIE